MKLLTRGVLLALLAASVTGGTAHAGFVTVRFSGVINDTQTSQVNVGDPFTVTFTYDLDAIDLNGVDVDPFGWFGGYRFPLPAAPVGFSYTAGSVSFVAQTSAFLSVDNLFDNPIPFDPDDDFFRDNLALGGETEGVPIGAPNMGVLQFIGSGVDIFPSDRPPATLDLADFEFASFTGSIRRRSTRPNPGTESRFSGTVLAVEVVQTPVPATAALLALGATVLAGCRRPARRTWPL